jgi:hypothetical protein
MDQFYWVITQKISEGGRMSESSPVGTIRVWRIDPTEWDGTEQPKEGGPLPLTIAGEGWRIDHVYDLDSAGLIETVRDMQLVMQGGYGIIDLLEQTVQGTLKAKEAS